MLTFESASVLGINSIVEKLSVRIPLSHHFCEWRLYRRVGH